MPQKLAQNKLLCVTAQLMKSLN